MGISLYLSTSVDAEGWFGSSSLAKGGKYDYVSTSKPRPKNALGTTKSGKNYIVPKGGAGAGAAGGAKPATTTLKEKKPPKDPNKNLGVPPGVESKQSILSGNKDDFKDHSPADHYKILGQVSHDAKLSHMHNEHINDKTKGMSGQDHQSLADELSDANQQSPSLHLAQAAKKHSSKAEALGSLAEKTKEGIGVETGKKELEQQVATAKLGDKEEKLSVSEYGPEKFESYQEASTAFKDAEKTHKQEAKEKADTETSANKEQATGDYEEAREKWEAKEVKAKAKFKKDKRGQLNKIKKEYDKVKSVKAPKSADFGGEKVPAKAKNAWAKQMETAKEKWEANKDSIGAEKYKPKKPSPSRKEYEHEVIEPEKFEGQKPAAAEWKAKAAEEKEAAGKQEEEARAPESPLEHAEMQSHTLEANNLIDNLNSHIDSGTLDDATVQHYTNLRDTLDAHKELDTVPTKQHKGELKAVQKMAGKHGKEAYGAEGGAEAPKEQPKTRTNIVGSYQTGRAAGEAVGAAAASTEGAGALGGQALGYAVGGAVTAGHYLLNKDDDIKTPTPKRQPKPKGQVDQASMEAR